jgi:hypothetical protein
MDQRINSQKGPVHLFGFMEISQDPICGAEKKKIFIMAEGCEGFS